MASLVAVVFAVITAFFVNVVAVVTVTEGDVLTSTPWACGDALKQSMQIEQCVRRQHCTGGHATSFQ